MLSLLFFISLIFHTYLCWPISEEICYHPLGCFRPLDHPQFPLHPEPPIAIATSFRLYNRVSPLTYRNIHYLQFEFDAFLPEIPRRSRIAIVIHGWMLNQDIEMYGRLRTALFNEYTQLIAVDWRGGSDDAFYPQSAANTVVVGREVALLIYKLHTCCEIDANDIHVIGFSLGAHVAANAGKWLQTRFQMKLGRISALDGAGVLLRNSSIALTKYDAHFVDAIHTSGGIDDGEAIFAQFGNPYPVGHVDFYPNGGRDQAHCITNPQYGPFCLHHAAIDYYISSLTQCRYLAVRCTSWQDYIRGSCNTNETSRMGFYSYLSPARGTFYLSTEPSWPYCERRQHQLPYSIAPMLTDFFQNTQETILSMLSKG